MTQTFLLADMGGTNIRFAVFDGKKISHYQSYKCQNFGSVFDALSEYKNQISNLPDTFIFAVPGVVKAGQLSFVNIDWTFSKEELENRFHFKNVVLLNDFEAVAFGLNDLSDEDVILIKDGEKEDFKPSVVMGAGTGLGVGVLLPQKDGSYTTLPSEAGHIAVSVMNETEEKIHAFIRQKCGRVSSGHLLSGAGIRNIYMALGGQSLSSEEIVSLAIQNKDEIARQAVLQMLTFWGDIAGDLALAFLAKGGIYLTGNIIQTEGMLDLLKASDFCSRFLAKGRHCQNLNAIPVYLIKRSDLAFSGLKQKAKNFLICC